MRVEHKQLYPYPVTKNLPSQKKLVMLLQAYGKTLASNKPMHVHLNFNSMTPHNITLRAYHVLLHPILFLQSKTC